MMGRATRPSVPVSSLYFDLQGDFGITKHTGGCKATDELIQLCHLQAGQSVLAVGCGMGSTTCYLAGEPACFVTAVDISPKMIQRSRERAHRQGVADRVEFKVADAQQLPFGEDIFDAVIDESVTAFVQNKARALSEYVRVTKPGGYVGLNEVTWIKEPSPALVRYVARIMAGAEFRTSEDWQELLKGAGLGQVVVKQHAFDARSQYADELRQLDVREFARAWYRFLTGSVASPAYREFSKEVMSDPGQLFRFIQHIGYGIYVGRKLS